MSRRALPVALRCVVAFALLHALPARAAKPVAPWTPPGADETRTLAAEAMVRFRQSAVDTLDEQSIAPYERVGRAARLVARRLGSAHPNPGAVIEAALDSLGLDTDGANDPEMPSVTLVVVRHPFRPAAQAVGYLLWWRGLDLRMQGVSLPAVVEPRLRTWWTGRAGSPYAAAITYRKRGTPPTMGLHYLRLTPEGFVWELLQYDGNGPQLGVAGDVALPDLDGDGRPELVAWSVRPPDSLLTVETGVAPVMGEAIYVDRGMGFVPQDARVVPGPTVTLRLFLEALRAGDRRAAEELLLDPTFLVLAEGNGWGALRSPRDFIVDRQEQGQSWPDWLGARVRGRDGRFQRWVFHFELRQGRWRIRDFIAEQPAPARAEEGKETR